MQIKRELGFYIGLSGNFLKYYGIELWGELFY